MSKELEARTYDFARRIIRLYAALPKSTPGQVLGKQLLRSGTSIGANYREAVHSRSHAEFLAKLGDCRKEAAETEYWLDLLIDEKLLPKDKLVQLREEANELTAILVASIKTGKSPQ